MRKLITLSVMLACVGSIAMAADLPATLLDPYLRVQVALAADTIKGITQEAAAIGRAAAELGAPAEKLAGAAAKLEAATDLKAARSAFGDVSGALIAYAEATGARPPADVRIAICPMVPNGWLQKGDEVRNPYYGSEMLHCGEFKK